MQSLRLASSATDQADAQRIRRLSWGRSEGRHIKKFLAQATLKALAQLTRPRVSDLYPGFRCRTPAEMSC